MHPLLRFYLKTWWLWLGFLIVFILLGIYATALFFIFIPGLLAYSLYFGSVRVKEEEEEAAKTRQAPGTRSQ